MDNPQEQLRQFLATLFDQQDIIEIRPIEIWRDANSAVRHSKVIRSERRWWNSAELLASYGELHELNVTQRANIFMGVNARSQVGGGKKRDVTTCRCIWADMDEVTPEVASWRCQEVGIPAPSVLVDSGYGVHLYWVLNAAVSVVDEGDRQRFERRLKSVYRLLDCDATSDVNRLLRLPGFWNVKDQPERRTSGAVQAGAMSAELENRHRLPSTHLCAAIAAEQYASLYVLLQRSSDWHDTEPTRCPCSRSESSRLRRDLRAPSPGNVVRGNMVARGRQKQIRHSRLPLFPNHAEQCMGCRG